MLLFFVIIIKIICYLVRIKYQEAKEQMEELPRAYRDYESAFNKLRREPSFSKCAKMENEEEISEIF